MIDRLNTILSPLSHETTILLLFLQTWYEHRCIRTWERELTTNCCRPTFPLSHRIGYIAVTCCTRSGDIYVTVKGVKCSGKVSRATIGWRLPWFRHPPINAPKQLSPNPDRTRDLPARGRVRTRARASIRRNASSARGFIARQKVAWRKACNNSPIQRPISTLKASRGGNTRT